MVDPISEEEIRRKKRIKQYQSHYEEIDNEPTGKMGGKKVKIIAPDSTIASKIFNKSLNS